MTTKTEDRIREMLASSHRNIIQEVDQRNDRRILPIFVFGVMVGFVLINASPIGFVCGVVSGMVLGSHWPKISHKFWNFVTDNYQKCNIDEYRSPVNEFVRMSRNAVARAVQGPVVDSTDDAEPETQRS